MIKDVLVALLTTTINRYSSLDTEKLWKDGVVRDLNIILDYVADISEEKRIKELEESCENDNEIIRNLNSKINSLETELNYYKHKVNSLKEIELEE